MNYLWSKRVFKVDEYNNLPTECFVSKQILENQMNTVKNKVLWIRNTSKTMNYTSDLDTFGELIYNIKEPIILVTTDGDRPVPSSYKPQLVEKILCNDKILKWYTQNYDHSIEHSKLCHYPIGLDMHTTRWLPQNNKNDEDVRQQKIQMYLDIRKQFENNKKMTIFCDAHLSATHSRRKELKPLLEKNIFMNFLDKTVSYEDVAKLYASHQFVLSPRGNGIDCHRTWEVFLLGSIVIVESSSLDSMFLENNLPVIIVNNFSELNEWTINDLEHLKNKYLSMTKLENIRKKIDPSYWIK